MINVDKLIKYMDGKKILLEENNKDILDTLKLKNYGTDRKNISDLNWNVAQLVLLKELRNFIEDEKSLKQIDDKIVTEVFILGEVREDGKRYIKDKDISKEILTIEYNYGWYKFDIKYNDEIMFCGEPERSWTYNEVKAQVLLTNSVKAISEQVIRFIKFRNPNTNIKKKYIYDFLNEFRTWLFINWVSEDCKDQRYYDKLEEIQGGKQDGNN